MLSMHIVAIAIACIAGCRLLLAHFKPARHKTGMLQSNELGWGNADLKVAVAGWNLGFRV